MPTIEDIEKAFNTDKSDITEDNIKTAFDKTQDTRKIKRKEKLQSIYGKNFYNIEGDTISIKKLNYRINMYKLFNNQTFVVNDLKIDINHLLLILYTCRVNFKVTNGNITILDK